MRKTIYILPVLICLSQWVFSQATYTIPDSQFASCLKAQYPQAFISANQINTTTASQYKGTIDCSSKFIKNIDGLKYFSSVTEINISGNQIDTLAGIFSTKFLSLVNFNCSGNNISTIFSLANVPSLENLNCSLNRIKALTHLDSLPFLANLDCKNNLIETIASYHPNAPLKLIDARNNKLKDLPYLSTTNYASLKNGGNYYLSDNYLGFAQVDNALKNIYEPIPKDRFNIFDFNLQNKLTFKNGTVVEFEVGDTLTLKLNYTPYTGDKFIWRFSNYLLSETSHKLFKILTIADTGEYFCEIQNNPIIPYSGMTLSTNIIKLKLKVNICPDIRNIQVVTKPNLCSGKNELVVKGFKTGYVYSLQKWNAFVKVSAKDSSFSNLAEGTYKLTINNDKGTCMVDNTNFQTVGISNIKAKDFILNQLTSNCQEKGIVNIVNYNASLNYRLMNKATSEVLTSEGNTISNLNEGNYMFIVSNISNNCFDTASVTFAVNSMSLNVDNYILTKSLSTCNNGGEATITNYNQQYIYKLLEVNTGYNAVSIKDKFINLPIGEYKLIVQNQGNCIDTSDNVVINMNTLKASDFILIPSTAACKDKGSILIQNYLEGYNYKLYNANGSITNTTGTSFTNLPNGTYTFVIENWASTCADTSNQTIAIQNIAAHDFSLNVHDATCTDDGKVEISNNYNAAYLYFLTNTVTGNTVNAQQGEFNNLKQGDYFFSVNNQLGTCKDTLKTNNIKIRNVGNCGEEVTPNGDGVNDNLTILEAGTTKIFDKSGVLIAEFNTPADWDCKNKIGHFVTSGVYALYVNDVFVKLITVFR